MSQLTVYIDGKELKVDKGTTILTAAKKAGKSVPTLCYHEDIPATASCGVCVVEIEGSPLKRACVTPVWDGMKIRTNSKKLRSVRKTLVEMILSNHEVVCPTCSSNNNCELQELANSLDMEHLTLPNILEKQPVDEHSPSIVRDPNKCINCGRCIEVCNNIQTVFALTTDGRGFHGTVTTSFDKGMDESPCVNCGQCTVYCPVGALREKNDKDKVWDALLDPNKHVVVQEAPAIRATLAEEFELPTDSVTVGKMYATLKQIGFDSIFDTNFSADLTIIEEGTEAIGRILKGENLPIITSCSPGWIKFVETNFPNLLDNVSTAKSPQQMMGVLTKTYYAEKSGIDPKDIVSVSIMPCTAKKFEAQRQEMNDSGHQDVDHVLTTREFIRMIKEADIDFRKIKEEEPYHALAAYTGAATIFGATGGVMEAALRTVWAKLTGEELECLDLEVVRGMQGIKEAELEIPTKDHGKLKAKVAVAHGLGNARKLMDKVTKQLKETGKSEYTFIEVMACPGGCVGGGGQPYNSSIAQRARRGKGLYAEDMGLKKRCSHHNEAVLNLYKDFLGEPNGHKAHELLHTHYGERSLYHGKHVDKK